MHVQSLGLKTSDILNEKGSFISAVQVQALIAVQNSSFCICVCTCRMQGANAAFHCPALARTFSAETKHLSGLPV